MKPSKGKGFYSLSLTKGKRGVTEHIRRPLLLNTNLHFRQIRPVSSTSHAYEIYKNNPVNIFDNLHNNPWGKQS